MYIPIYKCNRSGLQITSRFYYSPRPSTCSAQTSFHVAISARISSTMARCCLSV